ncbi:MAG TPA: ATP-binding protein, partial [Casimicrobiaceae bacterium]|nr:ATP-binding protein [Casimicrobiaceae bacterium]
MCGCSAAVANALQSVKDSVDIRLAGDHGAGVAELVHLICRDDAQIVPAERHGILVGEDRAQRSIYVAPHRGSVLIAGSSGIGKSTLATALTERMVEKGFEFCVLDPEGDYDGLEQAVCVGTATTAPSAQEGMELLRKRSANVVISTQALSADERPEFFRELLPQIASLRAKTGRPHWVIIDEAHHLIAAPRADIAQVLPEKLPATVFITVHPDAVAAEALQAVHYVIALGEDANDIVAMCCRAIGAAPPHPAPTLEENEVLFYERASSQPPVPVRPRRPKQQHKRHTRKYAQGELDEARSFYFRGADDRLNLRAQNLVLFAQIAQGVDADTWQHHRRRGEYSRWFHDSIKDPDLAREAASVEADESLDADESRRRIVDAIERRYTLPARAPSSQR